MKYLEDNFLSIVIITVDNSKDIIEKLRKLYEFLDQTFRNYEVIVVDNNSTDSTLELLKEIKRKITIIELPCSHSTQMALSAGVDMAIGDYLIEIPDISQIRDWSVIWDLYKKSQDCGVDFVLYAPENNSLLSKLFYKILNKNIKTNGQKGLTSSIATLSSRRGQNKVASGGRKSVNRNVSYVLTGLDYVVIEGKERYVNRRGMAENVGLFVDTLIFYTNVITRLMSFISIAFLCIAILTAIYSIVVFNLFETVAGWTSTVLILEVGFAGVFLMFAIISKYLDYILKNTLLTKNYIYRDVTKIS